MERAVFTIGAGVVLCAAAWGACGGEQTVTNKEMGFQITLPESWNFIGGGGAPTMAESSVAQGSKTPARLNVALFETDEKRSLKERVNAILAGTKKNYPDVTIDESAEAKVSGMDGYKARYSTKNQHFIEYWVVANKRTYMLQVFGWGTDFKQYAKDIDAIVASFKILTDK